MSKRLRHILSVLLLLVFITPTAVKLLDNTFHHHVFFSSRVKKGTVLHQYHRTCPIPGFTLSFYTVQKQTHQKSKQKFFAKVLIYFPHRLFSSELNYSTLLRAPPLSEKILL